MNDLKNLVIKFANKLNTTNLSPLRSGNISARFTSNSKNGFLITPSGKQYDTLNASDIVFVSGFQQLGVQGVLPLHHHVKDDSGYRRCADHYSLDGPRSYKYCRHHLLDLFFSNRCQHDPRVTIGRQRSRRII